MSLSKMSVSFITFLIVGLSACEDKIPDVAVGDLKMIYHAEDGFTGYKDVELYDSESKKTVHIPEGRYSTQKIGSDIIIKNVKGQQVGKIPLKHAIIDHDTHHFFLSSIKNSKSSLDIYGGKIYRPLQELRYGIPNVDCTIDCCTKTQECDNDGKNCTDVCHSCGGHQDQLWQKVTFSWDYEIFFGKPGDFEVATFKAKGQPQTKVEKLEEEDCH